MQIPILTNQQRMVARLLVQGGTNRANCASQQRFAIADSLGLSPRTVEDHIHNMRKKLNLKSKYVLAAKLLNLEIDLCPFPTTYKQKIYFLIYRGMTRDEIAQKVGCSYSYASHCFRQFNRQQYEQR